MVFIVLTIHVLLWSVLVGNLISLRRRRNAHATHTGTRKLSILVPARNEAENLAVLVPSILDQSYEDLELIVYDDDSTDDTEAVLAPFRTDARLVCVRSDGPPPGWLGKVAALFEAARRASGQIYLFLDADVRLESTDAVAELIRRFEGLPPRRVLTGLPALAGSGQMLVSMIPLTILSGLPWFLVDRTTSRSISALNGQCWVVDAAVYHQFEPHDKVRDKVLEDVEIGRYLKSNGVFPALVTVSDLVTVRMYDSFAAAWRGFRKNAYLIMGGSPIPFFAYLGLFALATWLSPIYSPYFLLSAWMLKVVSDRLSRIPAAVSLLAPVSFTLATFLQLDSAFAHWTGRVRWKGRNVSLD